MNHYLLKLTPRRPTFAHDMTAEEKTVMQDHVGYWSSLAERGIAIVFGPVADPAGFWGVAIVEVSDEEEARALMVNDPVVKAKLDFEYDVLPMAQVILRS